VAAALSGMKLMKAYAYLCNVKDYSFPKILWFVGRASQAKGFGTTQGCWPQKSVKFILHLLKNEL